MSDPVGYNGSYIELEAASLTAIRPATRPVTVPTPTEMVAAIKAAREPAILSEISHVVAELEKRWDGTSTLTVAARSTDSKVQAEVAERFRARGWSVKVGGTQRDGAHYALAPNPSLLAGA